MTGDFPCTHRISYKTGTNIGASKFHETKRDQSALHPVLAVSGPPACPGSGTGETRSAAAAPWTQCPGRAPRTAPCRPARCEASCVGGSPGGPWDGSVGAPFLGCFEGKRFFLGEKGGGGILGGHNPFLSCFEGKLSIFFGGADSRLFAHTHSRLFAHTHWWYPFWDRFDQEASVTHAWPQAMLLDSLNPFESESSVRAIIQTRIVARTNFLHGQVQKLLTTHLSSLSNWPNRPQAVHL